MDIGAIFLLLALTILIALFVARPIVRRYTSLVGEALDLSALLAERDRLLNALQELDFDNTLGKIPEEDYPLQRKLLLQQGATVMQKLEELQGIQSDNTEERLEAAVASRRADAPQSSVRIDMEKDEEIEAMIAARRSSRKGKSAGFCSVCGRPVLHTDRFCPHCGKPLK